MPEEDTSLFVKFEDPITLRKSILEASRNILISLQNFEHFKTIRNEKTILMEDLKKQINEVNQLFNQLRREMPKSSAVKLKTIRKVAVQEPVSAKPEELKSIEDQLSSIESMLGDMS